MPIEGRLADRLDNRGRWIGFRDKPAKASCSSFGTTGSNLRFIFRQEAESQMSAGACIERTGAAPGSSHVESEFLK
jgi:hypothetical protein